MRNQLFRLSGLAIVLVGASFGNEIANPGFESGNFTGWTLSGDTMCMGVVAAGSTFFIDHGGAICSGFGSSIVHSGTDAAYLAPLNADGLLSQTVPTIPGATYDINFWLASLVSAPAAMNDFSVSFGGHTLASSSNVSAFPFTDFDYHATANGTSATLTFASRNEFSYFVLDDVSLNQLASSVPEPSMLPVAAVAIAGIAGAGWRRRKVRRG